MTKFIVTPAEQPEATEAELVEMGSADSGSVWEDVRGPKPAWKSKRERKGGHPDVRLLASRFSSTAPSPSHHFRKFGENDRIVAIVLQLHSQQPQSCICPQNGRYCLLVV